ncbi:MAG TPA: MerR family transcriptional regulator [Streptosporangiaceae bacterium]|nr:MerR family transcriptional regulator [Streptosporangiaceae bacterium]
MEQAPGGEPVLSIGQVAGRTGLSVHALRFYEREGLLATPVHRDGGGRRLYSEWDVEWLELCIKLRESGMPLVAIRRYAELVRDGEGNEADRLGLLREHEERITAQLTALQACLEVISFKVALYEERLARGAWRDPLYTPPASGGPS